MGPDEKKEIYDAGYKEGQKHTKPSELTLAMFENLEKNLNEHKELSSKRDEKNDNFHNEILKSLQEVLFEAKGGHAESRKTNGRMLKLEKKVRTLEDNDLLADERRKTHIEQQESIIGFMNKLKTGEERKRDKWSDRVWNIAMVFISQIAIGLMVAVWLGIKGIL